MEKKRILHISKYYPPFVGGIEQVAYNVVNALKSTDNYKQEVFCFNEKEEDVIDDIYEDIKVIRVGSKKKVSSQSMNYQYGKYLKEEFISFKPDIVVFHYPNPFAAHFLLKIMKSVHYNGKFVLYWHCDIIKQKLLKKLFIKQNYALLDGADTIIATSPAYLEGTDYLPKYKDKVKVIPLCIGKERTNVTEEQKLKANEIRSKYKDKKIVFFFGRHTEYKGLRYLIECNEYLDRDKVEIVIAGKGELTEELKKLASKYKNIVFVGRLSDEDINAYLIACDIFAFPSITRNEAFGISLAEGMYFAKPACTFAIPGSGVNWVCPNNVCGLEATNRDVKGYADNINRLIEDNELYDRLSKESIKRCNELFTYSNFSKNVLKIYDRLNNSSSERNKEI